MDLIEENVVILAREARVLSPNSAELFRSLRLHPFLRCLHKIRRVHHGLHIALWLSPCRIARALDPYDYVIVTSSENANLPKDVAARFGLSVGLFCQGVILSNGPQVDPGFKGKLFCLLFNTSNSPVVLKRRQHYATIEFTKLLEPTCAYEGKYQGKIGIIHYLPSNTLKGGVSELKEELEKVKSESQKLHYSPGRDIGPSCHHCHLADPSMT